MNSPIWLLLIILLTAVVIVQGVLLVGVMRQVGGILVRLSPARPGEIEGGPEVGTHVKLDGLAAEREALVLFVSPTCSICGPVIEALPALRRNYPQIELVAVISGGDDLQRRQFARKIGPSARTDLARLHKTWKVPGTPFAVAVDRGHRVQSAGVANNLEHLEAMAEALLHPQQTQGMEVDFPSPDGETTRGEAVGATMPRQDGRGRHGDGHTP